MEEIREFQLYNSMTKQKEIFIPKEPGKVRIYMSVVFQLMISATSAMLVHMLMLVYLKQLGYQVVYVREFTDFDDNIIKRAEEVGEEALDLSKRFYHEYLGDMHDLHVFVPTEQPCVSENMSDRYLTCSFDIHGSGIDHENELPQSCAASPNTCEIKYWMHNGFVNTDNEKMSKSLANFSTVLLRYLMMSTHYRSPVNYSQKRLELASEYVYLNAAKFEPRITCVIIFFTFRERNPVVPNIRVTPEAQMCIDNLKTDLYAKMSDDLKTQDFLNAAALKEILKFMNKLRKAEQREHSLFMSLAEMEKEVKMVLDTLGLMSSSSYSEVLRHFKLKALTRTKLSEEYIMQQIELRTQAERDNEYLKSAQIRLDLAVKGIFIVDYGDGTQWRPCVRRIRN
ncbi:hypothetical protein MKX01_030722 [Papaver californicum]|nr:hypothetical protein MKX01_030722 [Papaver californicum]